MNNGLYDISTARELRVTLETPGGTVWSGVTQVADISQWVEPLDLRSFSDSPIRMASHTMWEMNLVGLGDLFSRDDTIKDITKNKTTVEWRCDFCGSINPREYTRCSQCGGFRSFLYEV